MILFADWKIQTTGLIARQYDNLSRRLEVIGDLPAGWDWAILVRAEGVEGAEDIIPLKPMDGGVGTTLDRNQLSISGYYSLQLRGTKGEVVKHTNIAQTFVPKSLTGNGHWPSVPSEFREVEEHILELNSHPPVPGENGFWLIWNPDADQYEESGFLLQDNGTPDAVQYIEQKLTEEQKAQARTNIGAADAETVRQLSEEKGWKYDKYIEFSEETAGFELTAYDDGTPFDFTEVEITAALKNGATSDVWGDVTVVSDGFIDGNYMLVGGSNSFVSKMTNSGRWYLYYLHGVVDDVKKSVSATVVPNVATMPTNAPTFLCGNKIYHAPNFAFSTKATQGKWETPPTKFTTVKSGMTIGAGSSIRIRGR